MSDRPTNPLQRLAAIEQVLETLTEEVKDLVQELGGEPGGSGGALPGHLDFSQLRRAKDGKLYLPDPGRPGKYLEVSSERPPTHHA